MFHSATNRMLNTSRNITDRNHYLLVTTQEGGEHRVCFEKESPDEQQLQFDIIDERYLMDHVPGKEEVLKILSSGRRMIQHL